MQLRVWGDRRRGSRFDFLDGNSAPSIQISNTYLLQHAVLIVGNHSGHPSRWQEHGDTCSTPEEAQLFKKRATYAGVGDRQPWALISINDRSFGMQSTLSGDSVLCRVTRSKGTCAFLTFTSV